MSMDEKFLSQDEIDALLKGVSGEEDTPAPSFDPSAVRTYNLATQERIVRGRMPSLELINERFARLFRVGLYNFLHRNAEVSVSPIRTTKYSEFLRHLVVPTNLNLIHIKPLRGRAMLVMDPRLVFMLVDNFFGGDGRFQTRIEGRDFTQTEMRIIQRVLGIVFESLAKAWELAYKVEFEYIRSEINTQFANIATPNEIVVTTVFGVEVGGVTGELHLCIPYSMVEPIRDILRSSMRSESISHDYRWANLLKQQIQSAEVEVVANLTTIELTLRDVMNMRVDDIIPIDLPETVDLKVDHVPIIRCSYGKLSGQYALRVETLLHNSAVERENSTMEDQPDE
jgi:flagellar motor switch protein FliM